MTRGPRLAIPSPARVLYTIPFHRRLLLVSLPAFVITLFLMELSDRVREYQGPALAPMYTALCLTSLDLFISHRKLRWAGHVRRMDWSRLPRKFLTSWADAPRTGTLLNLRARPHARAPADRLQHRQGGRAARRLAELGAAAQDREKWRKLAARLPLAPVPVGTKPISHLPSPNKRGRNRERTQSEHALIAQPAPDQAATTWSQRLRSRG
jgi:hypothetical protein